nr:MAG TPA: hypothetical protein [Caudoviricetes sp.]
MRTTVRNFDKLPLLTPEEALERAWEEGGSDHPVFDRGYRVRGLNSWKAVETLLQQNDVRDITVASFGLKRFEEILDAIAMLHERGWHLWQTSANVYVDGEKRTVQAIRARYRVI